MSISGAAIRLCTASYSAAESSVTSENAYSALAIAVIFCFCSATLTIRIPSGITAFNASRIASMDISSSVMLKSSISQLLSNPSDSASAKL